MKMQRQTVLLTMLAAVLIIWFSWGQKDFNRVMKIARTNMDTEVVKSMGEIQYIPGDMHAMRTLNVYAPEDAENLPVVVFMHGGGWRGGTPNAVIWGLETSDLQDAGILLVSITHRANYQAMSPGPEEDVAAAIAWTIENIAEYGGDPERIFLAGHSSGAHVMTLAALDPSLLGAHELDASMLAGVIHMSGIIDLTISLKVDGGIESITRYAGEDPERLREASPLYHIGKGPLPPFLIVHGEDEGDWAKRESEQFRDALIEHDCEARVVEVAGVDHYTLVQFLNPRQKEFMDFIGVEMPEQPEEPAEKEHETEEPVGDEPEGSHQA